MQSTNTRLDLTFGSHHFVAGESCCEVSSISSNSIVNFSSLYYHIKYTITFVCVIFKYRILTQIVRGGKLSRLHALLVIRGKTFMIVWPVQFTEKSGTRNNSKFSVTCKKRSAIIHMLSRWQ